MENQRIDLSQLTPEQLALVEAEKHRRGRRFLPVQTLRRVLAGPKDTFKTLGSDARRKAARIAKREAAAKAIAAPSPAKTA